MTTTIAAPAPRIAGRGLWIERISPRLSRLILPNHDQIIHWSTRPIAVYDNSGYIYLLEGTVNAARGAITKHWGNCPTMLMSVADLDYIIGQALSKAGLMLVRRLEP
jgi:hypothetical protein